MKSLKDLTDLVIAFREERDWRQFHNPKDSALSLALEAAEVLELMQWKNGDELQAALSAKKEQLGEELSDVLYWILVLAHDQNVDLATAFQRKMTKNREKYPVEKSKGKALKYSDL